MSAGFWSAGRGKGTQTPSPCPEPPSPLERNSLSYFGTLITVGTYKGGRSLASRPSDATVEGTKLSAASFRNTTLLVATERKLRFRHIFLTKTRLMSSL